jgi:hypothetical protein
MADRSARPEGEHGPGGPDSLLHATRDISPRENKPSVTCDEFPGLASRRDAWRRAALRHTDDQGPATATSVRVFQGFLVRAEPASVHRHRNCGRAPS